HLADALAAPEQMPARIDTLLAAADVLLAAGESDRAGRLIAEATVLAEPEGFVRRFCDAGPRVTKRLVEFAAGRHSEPGVEFASRFFLGTLASALAPSRRGAGAPAGDKLVDALTTRELDVLDLLIAGRSYTDIAAELYVSRNTVKSHVRHIYTKLGATSRSEAAEAATSLGLV
ncbi:MAG: LuxR C-terminal-related transcriptional regulator, partial [Ilumatobacteraceae bacterium]